MDMNEKFVVLVVDDDPNNLHLLAEILQDHYRLAFATSGQMALTVTEKLNPDIILLDIMMPGMDGYEVCKRLKSDEKTQEIPVIFVTALNEINDEAKGLELGAIDYLIKPLSPAIVKARIKNHLLTKKKIERLANLAAIDGLTEIPNRRQFDERLHTEWNQAKRDTSFLALIMMDIDYFKQYNDNYGHAAGDDCLVAVARAISGTLKRPSDFVARYGGEEFVALLPGTDASKALLVANNICEAVRRLEIPHRYSDADNIVTISLGLSTVIPRADMSRQAFIEQADKMLYQAKHSGRNRVCAHENGKL